MTPTEKQKGKLKWSAMTPRVRDELVRRHLFPFLSLAPYYTTNPADCARVKERFDWWKIERTERGFFCVVRGEGEFYGHAKRDTECESFCLAALLASGVEIED